MDRATLDMHRSLCVQEPADQRFTGSLQHLNEPEQALYQALRDDTLGPRLRLEQERISYAWLKDFLRRATSWWPEAEAAKILATAECYLISRMAH